MILNNPVMNIENVNYEDYFLKNVVKKYRQLHI